MGEEMARVTVPGKSAAQLQPRARLIARTIAVSLSVGIGLMVIDFGQRTPILFVGVGVVVITGIVGVVLWVPLQIVANLKEVAEVRHGYTTLPYEHQDVEERDPQTGRVIRAAGEPYLSSDIRAERLSESYDSRKLTEAVPQKGRPGITLPRWYRVYLAGGIVVLLITLVIKLLGLFQN